MSTLSALGAVGQAPANPADYRGKSGEGRQVLAGTRFRIAHEQVTDDSHRPRAGRNDPRRGLQRNSADGHDGKAMRICRGRSLSHCTIADRVVARCLGRGGEHGTYGQIRNRLSNGFSDLLGGVRRQAHQKRWSRDSTHGSWCEIVLTDVHARGVGHHGEVGSVVHDHTATRPVRLFDYSEGEVEKSAARQRLRSELEEKRPGREKGVRDVEGSSLSAFARLHVDDGVQSLARITKQLRHPGHARHLRHLRHLRHVA